MDLNVMWKEGNSRKLFIGGPGKKDKDEDKRN